MIQVPGLNVSVYHTHAHAHMHAHTHLCVHTAHGEYLRAKTYRDKDGLIKQVRRRVKQVEEKTLLVQRKGEQSVPVTLGPGNGVITAHSPSGLEVEFIQKRVSSA